MRQKLLLLTVFAALAACTPFNNTRGNFVDAERLDYIKTGETTQDQVARILGSPSAKSEFGEPAWYYIGQKTEAVAFFTPEVKKHEVTIIRFNKEGVVQAVEKVDETKLQAIKPVARATPSPGSELTIMQQLLGNVGRFQGIDKKER
ncbi:MAG: outer membrane protein assembly factor BamE [Dongiaceae bacterium]